MIVRATAALATLALLTACSDAAGRTPTPAPARAAEPSIATAAAEPQWTLIDPPAAPGALGASLHATPEGTLLTWLEPRGEGHVVRLATLRGSTWSAPTDVVASDTLVANWADFPRAARGGDGALYVTYLSQSGESAYAYDLMLMRSRDGGAHFEALGPVHRDGTATEHGFVSMVPSATGLRLFWLDGRASVNEGPTAVYSAHVEQSIGEAVRVDERVCDCCQTDATQGPTGAVVAYRDRDAAEHRDISVSRWLDGAFSTPALVHADGWEIAGCPVNGPALDADGDSAVVTWFTGADGGSVRAAFSSDGARVFGAPIIVDAEQPPGRVDVVMLESGAAVSWLARAGASAEVRVRFVHADGRLGASSVVAQTSALRASGFPVIVRERERLLLSYRDASEPGRLHVASLGVNAVPLDASSVAATPARPAVSIGDALPRAALLDAEGNLLALDELSREGPLVLAFFARWCQPCRDELRALQALAADLPPGTRIIAVSLDEGSAARALTTARGWGFAGAVLRDAGAASALGVPPLPGLFVFAEGRVRGAWRGAQVAAEQVRRALARHDTRAP